ENKDGILSWEDFRLLAEKFARIQRRGREPEKEVVDRWKSIFEKWWNELTSYADSNKVGWLNVVQMTNMWILMNGSTFSNNWPPAPNRLASCQNFSRFICSFFFSVVTPTVSTEWNITME
ncbi:sarcoplasmic calcium-binding proteins I, III, and IV-like protein, partial [Euroglyphus maynei]